MEVMRVGIHVRQFGQECVVELAPKYAYQESVHSVCTHILGLINDRS